MLINFLSDHTFLPDRAGGRESSIHDLASVLHRTGRRVRVVARESDDRLQKYRRWFDLGFRPRYPVHRVKDPIKWVCAKLPSEEIVVANLDNRHVPRFVEKYRGLRGFLYIRDAQFLEKLPHAEIKKRFFVIANSEFVAGELRDRGGIQAHVFPPLIVGERYRTAARGRFVTFINPIPKKGLHVALAAAQQLPHVPFQFIEGWPLAEETWASLRELCAPLKNVTLHRRRSDMRRAYKSTRVLLVPSQWDEAWGRVVTEAQFSGIPCVVSDSGALSKVAGRGGIVVDRLATPERWADAINSAYVDGVTRQRLREGAQAEAVDYTGVAEQNFQRFLELIDKGGEMPLDDSASDMSLQPSG